MGAVESCCAAAARPADRAASPSAPVLPLDPSVRTAIVMPICNEHVPTVFGGLRGDDRFAAGHRRVGSASTSSSSATPTTPTSAPPSRPPGASSPAGIAAEAGGDAAGAARALPLAPAPHQAQGRQRRRLLPPLGRRLPLLRRPRRRQRHDRRMPDDAGAHDGGASRRRHHPDRAAARSATTPCMPACSSSAPRAYGPLFTAGMRFWQLGESHYWGHNAILRMAPFIAPLRAGADARARARSPARSCRTTSSRRR